VTFSKSADRLHAAPIGTAVLVKSVLTTSKADRMQRKTKKTYTRRKDPSQDRSRTTISRIIDATWELLGDVGAKGITTRSIAARSGVTVGSIYQYFPHKEAILLELYKRRLADVVNSFQSLNNPELIALGPIGWDAHYTRAFDKIGWNQRAQLELNKACRFDPALEKLHQTHLARMQEDITELYRHFYPKAEGETLRLLCKFLYGLERLEAELLQRESGSRRDVIRAWRTDILRMFVQKFHDGR
jgi:AcrR family transcriptional regulator